MKELTRIIVEEVGQKIRKETKMGGFLLYVKGTDEEIDGVNMPCMGIFFEVLKQADLEDDWEESIVRCSKDDDLQCEARGPLCEGKAVGDLILDFGRFLALNRKAKEWLAANPDFENSVCKNNWSSGSTDHQVATRTVESFISNLEKLANKEKTLFFADEAMHNSAYPCERNLTVCVDEHAQCLELVDYDYAKEHQDKLRDLNIKGMFTKKEAIGKDIVFAGALDSGNQDRS